MLILGILILYCWLVVHTLVLKMSPKLALFEIKNQGRQILINYISYDTPLTHWTIIEPLKMVNCKFDAPFIFGLLMNTMAQCSSFYAKKSPLPLYSHLKHQN